MRLLGIPTVVDRMVQQAINQVLTPIYPKSVIRISLCRTTQRNPYDRFGFKPRVGSITDDNVKSNCFMIENIPSKGVCFLDFIATFAMSYQIFGCFFPNTKISENSDGAKP